jgi:hypothetical protein
MRLILLFAACPHMPLVSVARSIVSRRETYFCLAGTVHLVLT